MNLIWVGPIWFENLLIWKKPFDWEIFFWDGKTCLETHTFRRFPSKSRYFRRFLIREIPFDSRAFFLIQKWFYLSWADLIRKTFWFEKAFWLKKPFWSKIVFIWVGPIWFDKLFDSKSFFDCERFSRFELRRKVDNWINFIFERTVKDFGALRAQSLLRKSNPKNNSGQARLAAHRPKSWIIGRGGDSAPAGLRCLREIWDYKGELLWDCYFQF